MARKKIIKNSDHRDEEISSDNSEKWEKPDLTIIDFVNTSSAGKPVFKPGEPNPFGYGYYGS